MTKTSSSEGIILRPKQLSIALHAALGARQRVLVKGAPGVGKTQIIEAVCKKLGMDLILMHPSVSDPTDFKGMPFVLEDGSAEFIPFGDLRKIDGAKKPTVGFLDDLGQGTTSVQAACMQLFDKYRKHPHVTFLAATNRREDRAGVTGLLEPVKSRFATILSVEPNAEDWSEWALDNDMPPELIAYIRNVQPEALFKHEPSADISNSPNPRTWEHVGHILKMDIGSEDIRYAMITGAVGEAAASSFVGFLKIAKDAPSVDDIIANPNSAPIPTDLSAMYAVSSALAHRASTQNFGPIAIYVERMFKAEKGEFCAYLLRDAIRKTKELVNHPSFGKLAKSDVAKLVFAALKVE